MTRAYRDLGTAMSAVCVLVACDGDDGTVADVVEPSVATTVAPGERSLHDLGGPSAGTARRSSRE